MIRTLFVRNLRHHLRLLAALWMGLALFETLIVWVASLVERGPGLRAMLELMIPPEAREAFITQFGLMSFGGGVAFGFQHPVSLVAALAGVIVVATIPAAERESGLLDLILSGPVARARYLAAVLALLVIAAVALPLALLAGTAAGLALVAVPEELAWWRYAPSAARLTLLLLALGSGALFFAAAARRRGQAVARAVGVTLALYVLEILADLWEPFARIRWLSPFHFFKPIAAAIGPGAPLRDPLVLLATAAALCALALVLFKKQDL